MKINALNDFVSLESTSQSLTLKQNLKTVTPISIPQSEPEKFILDSTTGNAVFNLEWTGGEYYVGKSLSLKYLISDSDGFDPANLTIKWYDLTSGGSYTPASPLTTGD